MAKAVFCIARSEAQASNIIERLKRANFSASDVSMLFPDISGTKDFAHEQHSKLPEGAAAGGVAAGVVGGAVGWLAGVGALAIPGLRPLIAAGPVMAALSGAAAGAAIGGVTGALIGVGIPEYEAKRYGGKIGSGNILISVHTRDGRERECAERIFEEVGADDVSYAGEARPSA
jgi:hypothetical protein